MKYRIAMAMWFFALTAAAQQAPDKPSPVPHRPVRPSFVRTQLEKSGQPPSRKTTPDQTNAPQKSESQRSRAGANNTKETGIACFFSSIANGGLTASGIRLNSEELVAGHPKLPLGSWVRVRNLSNGQTVDVRIVDRFPESSKRVVNLSEAAARKLGFIKAGTAPVELESIERSPSAARE